MQLYTVMDTDRISGMLSACGVKNTVVDQPTHYLCNEAYFHALKKYEGRAVFIHIPPKKYMDKAFIDMMKQGLLFSH